MLVEERHMQHSLTEDSERTAEAGGWFALWTHSHCEQLVHDQLVGNGFNPFLPMIGTWSRRAGARRRIRLPMFPGYLFVRCRMDKESYIGIRKSRGLARILGERWDRLAVIADAEIEAIQRVVTSELPVLPHPYLQQGQRVRITGGPLADVEGILVQSKPNKGLLVLAVNLLQRSVAVEVDCTLVAPVASPTTVVATRPSCQWTAASLCRQ